MSTYMTLEEYTATLKVGDEVTIKYYSITGEKEIKEKILKITKSGTIYLRSTNCKDALSMELMNEVLNAYAKADFRFAHALNVFQGLIDKAPTVEERKHRHWEDIDLDTSVCSVCKNRKNTKQNTARSAALKWKIMGMTMMNKYIQQFLDANDLQAGERFYILDKDYKDLIIQEEE